MQEVSAKLQAILDALPHRPGIYLHKDADGTILYVGKATSLYSRVRQYFGDPADLSPGPRRLMQEVLTMHPFVADAFLGLGGSIFRLVSCPDRTSRAEGEIVPHMLQGLVDFLDVEAGDQRAF